MPSLLQKSGKEGRRQAVPGGSAITPPRIDPEKCTHCGLCADVCVIFQKQGERVSVARPGLCIHCGHCGSVCPTGAILDTSAEAKKLTKKDLALLPSPESLQFLFRSRRSVRRYKDKPVSRTDIGRILEASRYTPTGVNNQAIHYIVIDSPGKIAELRNMTLPAVERLFGMAERIAAVPILAKRVLGEQFARDLKTHFLPGIRVDFERTRKGYDDRLFYHAPAILLVHGEKLDDMAFSCAVALFNGSMLAHTLGIGCCLNGFLALAANHDKQVKRWLGIPKNHKCHGAMTFGYQAVKYNRLVRRNPPRVRWLG